MNERADLFELFNNFFDKIYVISLEKSIDRHENLHKLLRGLDYEIYWGVDGITLNLDELQKQGAYESALARKVKLAMKTEANDMSMGHIGCALSHNGIYRKILADNHEKCLILEDDIAIDFGSVLYLRTAMAELPSDWELFYLGYLYNNNSISFQAWIRLHFVYPIINALGYTRYDPKRYRCKFPRHFSEHLDRSGYHYGTHAYGITATGAQKIIDSQYPIHRESDNAIAYMCMYEMINAFSIKERVFHQNREKFSSLTRSTGTEISSSKTLNLINS